MSRTVAFLDSCVLYPLSLRDILIQFSYEGIFQAKWSSLVRQEVIRNVEKDNPTSKGKLGRTFDLMEESIADFSAEPTDETRKSVIGTATDAKDVDILTAAIDGGCTHLVTSNLKDFDIAFASARGGPQVSITNCLSNRPMSGFNFQNQLRTRSLLLFCPF